MKKTKTFKKMIVLLVMILILLLIIFGILYFNPTNKNLDYIYDTDVEGNIEIMPLNVAYGLSEYNGVIDQRTIYKALYLLVSETIPTYRKNLEEINSIGVTKYFKDNHIIIAKELGITEEKDFISFINEITKLKAGELILEEYTFHPEAVMKGRGYLDNILLIKYAGNEKIGLYVRIYNSINENIYAVSCSGGVTSKYLEYEYGSELENIESEKEPEDENIVRPEVEMKAPGRVIN